MAFVYQNLETPQNTGSGLGEFVYLCPVNDIADIKCPEAPFAAPGDEVKVKAAHTLKQGKKFIKVRLAPDKNGYKADTQGDKGFQKFAHSATIFIPGSYAEVHEFAKNVINTPLVAIVPDGDCEGHIYYQFGCDCVAAYLAMNFDTGTTADGVKGYTGTITYSSKSVLMYIPDPEQLLVAGV